MYIKYNTTSIKIIHFEIDPCKSIMTNSFIGICANIKMDMAAGSSDRSQRVFWPTARMTVTCQMAHCIIMIIKH